MKNETSKTLNALRMGVIPNILLQELMVGRESELEEFDHLFHGIKQDGCSSVKFIKGEYGTGKSFLLQLLKQKALAEGFVVATIPITGGFNLSKFDSFYVEVMAHLESESSTVHKGTSFEEIFENWIKSIKKEKAMMGAMQDITSVIATLNAFNTAFSLVLLTYIRAKISNNEELAKIAAAWIKGDKNVSYELKKQLNVKGSVDIENAVSIFRGFAAMLGLMGYSGLIILVDELELIMNNRSDTRMKSYANIRYMMDACGTGEFEKCGFVFAGTQELFQNDEKGFKSYAALNQRIGSLIPHGKHEVRNLRQPIVTLKAIEPIQFLEMTDKIMALHLEHYQYTTQVEAQSLHHLAFIECEKMSKGEPITIRNFIKKLLEILDLMEKRPDLPIFKAKVAGLKRQ